MGNSASALPYSIDDEVHPATRSGSYGFSIHAGKRKSDKMEVTVFKGEKSVMSKTGLVKSAKNPDPALTQIFPGLHHFSKVKTLVHPNLLRIYATLDTDYPDGSSSNSLKGNSNSDTKTSGNNYNTDTMNPASLSAMEQTATTGTLIIVTEPVIPLEEYLQKLSISTEINNTQRQDCISWGIQNLIQALTFLHTTAKVAHGNLCPHAIYVTPSGDFKLSALHLLTPIGIDDGATGPTKHFRHFERDVTPNEYRSPERIEGRWDAISTCPIHAMDSFSLGVLLPVIYEHPGAGTTSRLPQKLEKAAQRLRGATPQSRPRILPLAKCPLFDTPYVRAQQFLDEIATQPAESKLSFYKTLPDLISNHVLSRDAALYKVLPVLEHAISIITSSDLTLVQDVHRRECLAVLPPLFAIASTNLTPDEFSRRLGPNVIQKLFRVNDRAIRGALLTRISLFSTTLSPASLNGDVFEPMCSGFSDSSAPLRELTLKSAIVLVPSLTPANLEKLSRYLVRLQMDPENSIRTNTVIFIGKVAPSLSDMAKSKLMLPAFVRALKDGFAPCRLAALKAVVACREHFDESSLALEVLPVVVPRLVDDVAEVRAEAVRVVENFMGVLKELGERMGQDESRRMLIEKGETDIGGAGAGAGVGVGGWMKGSGGSGGVGSSSVPPGPTPAPAPTSGKSGYLSGLGSWATSKISSSATAEGAPAPSSANRNCAEITITKPNSTQNSQQQQQALEKKKNLPSFSSLSLSDANIGGNSGGWSDDDDEFNNLGGAQHQNASNNATNTSQQQSADLLPSWASESSNADEDFMSKFNDKPIIRPRAAQGRPAGVGGGKLKTPASGGAMAARRKAEMALRRKEKAKEKAAVLKLTDSSKGNGGLDDGWDDF